MTLKRGLAVGLGLFFLAVATPGANREPLWKVKLAAEIAGAPAACGDLAVVVTKAGAVIALDRSGKTIWRRDLPGGCLAAPAVDDSGNIYAAGSDGSLTCLSPEGKPRWKTDLEQSMLATPLLGRADLFAVGAEGRISKVRLSDGVVLQQAELGLAVHSSPVWDAKQINFLVPAKDFFLLAIDQKLNVLWRFRTAGVNFSSPAVTPKNEIYFSSMGHFLYKLDADGRLLWAFEARHWLKASPIVDSKGRVYIGGYDRQLYALSASGKRLWQFQGQAQFTASATLDSAGTIYCGDTSGRVYAIKRNGRLAWEHKSPDFITSDLTILPNRILLAGSIDGTLLAFRIRKPMSKKAWWAKYLGNLANSGFDEP